jgi:hypothetical protein
VFPPPGEKMTGGLMTMTADLLVAALPPMAVNMAAFFISGISSQIRSGGSAYVSHTSV